MRPHGSRALPSRLSPRRRRFGTRRGGYRSVLGSPGVPWVLVTSLLARLAHPVAGLAVVILAAEETGSFAHAGLVFGAWLGFSGLGCLASSRLVDRGHAAATLRGTAVVSSALLLVIAAVPAPHGLLILGLTAGAGLTAPPVVPATRALWSLLQPTAAGRASVSALDAALQELVYIAGPAVAGASALASPRLGLAIAAVVCLVGAELFASTPGLRRVASRREQSHERIDARALVVPVASSALLVGALSVTEVAVVAAADAAGAMAASGLLLALWGVGSLVAGLVAGAYLGRGNPLRWLLWLVLGIALTTAGYAASPGLLALAVALSLGGLLVAPALAAIDSVVLGIAPPGTVARTFALVAAAGLGGSAAGAAGAGVLAQWHGPDAAFLAAAGAAALAGLVVAVVEVAGTAARRRARLVPPDGGATTRFVARAAVPTAARGTACCGRRPCWEVADGLGCVVAQGPM